jgi:hypothetical protein
MTQTPGDATGTESRRPRGVASDLSVVVYSSRAE